MLDRAADLIRRDGLAINEFWPGAAAREFQPYTPGAPVCVLGAVHVVRMQGEGRLPARRPDLGALGCDPAVAAVAGQIGCGPQMVWMWSDRLRIGRRWRAVRALRAAARRCRRG